MGGAVLFFPSYLAAIRPSSIRHRHTSRGCLWRTSRRRTNKDGRGIEMFKKKSHLSERKDVSGDKLSVSKGNRSCCLNREGTFQEVLCLHCASLSLKLSWNSCGLWMCSWGHKGTKASSTSQSTTYRLHKKGPLPMCTQSGPEVPVSLHLFICQGENWLNMHKIHTQP